jgi:nucleotide-binding universal stress UspA family protein
MSWLPKRCVVVPIDFSDLSFAALDSALELVARPEHLHLIHVLAAIEPNDPGVIWGMVDNKSRSHHAEQALRQRLTDPKYQGLQIAVAFGDPGQEIANFAKRLGADLIVLPSHGRTGISRLLIGSVAERVVRLAHCPVLVLRT